MSLVVLLEFIGIVLGITVVILIVALAAIFIIDGINTPNFKNFRVIRVYDSRYTIGYTNIFGRWRDNLFKYTNKDCINVQNRNGNVIESIKVLSYYLNQQSTSKTVEDIINLVHRSKITTKLIIKTYKL